MPDHNCQERLIKVVNSAKDEVLVMCYNFNDEKIAETLIRARDRGVSVALVTDKTQRNHTHSQIPFLRRRNIPVYSDDKVAIAHNKVLIIDEKITVTGSFNLTDSAQQRNAENLLFITSKDLAQQYKSYWQSRRDLSQKLSPD